MWRQNFLNCRHLTSFSKRYCTLILWWQNFLLRRHLTSFLRHWVCEKISTFWLFVLISFRSAVVSGVGVGSWFFLKFENSFQNMKSYQTKSEKDGSNYLVKSWNRRLSVWCSVKIVFRQAVGGSWNPCKKMSSVSSLIISKIDLIIALI